MYLFYVTTILLFLYLLFMLLCIIFPIKLSVRAVINFWWFGIILFAIFAFYLDPIDSWDLSRLYRTVDYFRYGNAKITDDIFIVQNVLFWLVSKTGDNGWLVFIAILAWGGFVGGVIKQDIQSNKYSTQAILIGFLSAYSAHYIIYLVSGIRSALVASMWVYAYFRWYKENKVMYYGIMITGGLIHLISPILMVLTFTYHLIRQKGKWWNYILVIVAVFIIGYVVNNNFGDFFLRFNNDYMQMIGMKWNLYADYKNELRGEGFFRVLTLFTYLVCVYYLHKKGKQEYDIVGFITLIAFAGNNMDILINRLPYAIGVAAVPMINETVMTEQYGRRKLWLIVIGVPVALKFLWGLVMFLRGANFKGDINFMDFGDTLYNIMHVFMK